MKRDDSSALFGMEIAVREIKLHAECSGDGKTPEQLIQMADWMLDYIRRAEAYQRVLEDRIRRHREQLTPRKVGCSN